MAYDDEKRKETASVTILQGMTVIKSKNDTLYDDVVDNDGYSINSSYDMIIYLCWSAVGDFRKPTDIKIADTRENKKRETSLATTVC